MGTEELVDVEATGPGIIMMNGRAGQVTKGFKLQVDRATAAQYDFLKVIERPAHAAEKEAEAEASKPDEEKKTAPKGRSKSPSTRKRKTTRKTASKDTPPADTTGEAPIP